MRLGNLSGMFLALSLTLAACGGSSGADDDDNDDICVGVSTCATAGVSCSGDVLTTCEADANGCLLESAEDCATAAQICDDSGAEAVCAEEIVECQDDAACDGAAAGDSFCDGESTVDCATGADGCLDATVVDCTTDNNLCDESGASAECVADCADHPLCEGLADGATSCDGYFLNTCNAGADGCLDIAQESCGAALCDDQATPAVCGTLVETGLACAQAIPVASSGFVLAGTDFVADFAGGINLTDGSCDDTGDAGTVGAVMQVDLLANDTVILTERGGIDVILSIQNTCAVDGVCAETTDGGEFTGLSYTAEVAETVFLVVENFALTPTNSDYSIEVFINPTCGDGIQDTEEQCDDGNLVVGDGCDDSCDVEFGFACDETVPATCDVLQSLGTFASGDVFADFITSDPMVGFETDQFLITFSNTVLLQGTLSANGTGDFDFFMESEEGLVIESAVDGDEEFAGFLRAGTYLITIEAFLDDADTGYTLALDLGHPEETHAAGATVSGTGGPLDTDQFEVFTYTFSEDVTISGTLTGSTTSDMDLFILGSDGLLESSAAGGDEAFTFTLLAGTYLFDVEVFDGDQDTFALDFTTVAAVLDDLGAFAAADVIADTTGGAVTALDSVHHTITFNTDVLLTGLLDGNTTGDLTLSVYDTADLHIQVNGGAGFTDVALPAGTYILKVTADDLDVDGYNLALSTIAP